MKITKLQALQILDSRGNPTIRTFVTLEDGSKHVGSVPSGASVGSHEALELRDNEKPYHGKGVSKAVTKIDTLLSEKLIGQEADPISIDQLLINLDGTIDKSKLGANTILSVSLAVCRAAAHVEDKPLWKYLNEYYFQYEPSFPRLMVNVINGGLHASWNFDIQEFMIVPTNTLPHESVEIASEIYHTLGKVLKEKKLSTLVGDEGGYSPLLSSNEEVLDTIIHAATETGYENGKNYQLALDCAATEFYREGKYVLNKTGESLSSDELLEKYKMLYEKYHLLSLEDMFSESDWEAWQKIVQEMPNGPIIIGDDIFTTDPIRLTFGVNVKAANGIIIKPNQIGTMTETANAILLARKAGWKTIVSHRSGETEDSFIADLSFAAAANFLKSGGMSRSERLSKYNRLLEIEAGL